ncbi:hypothetical protein [Streptomyces sp. NPDC101776]|uniref:hypothetical protein n=1 Tax=Streptomyces sp. NPDC101776 TaxID=3366146 RepID=UPI003806F2E9
MTIKLGPVSGLRINGEDVTHCLSSLGFTGIDPSAATPPPCDWDTLTEVYTRIVRDELGEPARRGPHVIDQDGNQVRPPSGRLRNLGWG